MKFSHNLGLFIALILILTSTSSAQIQTDRSIATLPLDKSIRHGVLENGLTYYIKPLETPQPHLQMNFYVNVGFFNEGKEEFQFSHLIEHLAFRESESFPNGFASDSELLGRFGLDQRNLSGSTSNTYTLYRLEAPNKNKEAVRTGLKWFRDIAGGLNLSEFSINRERGVILQEHRGSDVFKNYNEAQKRMESELFPCYPTGKDFPDHIMNFPFKNIQQFYKKWYRPDRMGVVIVGNIAEVDILEKQLIGFFSVLENPEADISELSCRNIYFEGKPRFSYVERKVDSMEGYRKPIGIDLIFRNSAAAGDIRNWEEIIESIKGEMVTDILKKRLLESMHIYQQTFDFFAVYQHDAFPNTIKVMIQTEEESEKEALLKAGVILNQLKHYRITNEELSKVKEETLKKWKEDQETSAKFWVDQIENHYIINEALPENKILKIRRWISNLSKMDLHETIDEVLGSIPQDIGIVVAEYAKSQFSSERVIRKYLQNIFELKPQPYIPPIFPTNFLSENEIKDLPVGQKPEIEKGVGSTKIFKLKNGARVVLKPSGLTLGDEGTIVFHGFRSYGAKSFPNEDIYTAMLSPIVVNYSGVGNFDKLDLKKLYDRNSLGPGLIPYVNLNESGFKAEVTDENLEELMQLVYLYFSQPRWDREAFEDWKSIKSHPSYPINDLLGLLKEVTGDNSEPPIGTKRKFFKKNIEFQKVQDLYTKLFENAQDFTFILTGDFDEANSIQLFQKYIGNLPARNSVRVQEKQADSLPKGPVYLKVDHLEHYKTKNSHYGFKYVRERNENDNWREEVKIRVLGSVLNRMFYNLRAKEGFSLYFFGAGGNYNKDKNRYEVLLRCNCIPDELTEIREKIKIFIDNLIEGNVQKGIFLEGKNGLNSVFDAKTLSSTSGVAESLYEHYRYGKPLVPASEIEEYFKSLTIEDISETAEKIFKEENKYEVLMESGKEGNNLK